MMAILPLVHAQSMEARVAVNTHELEALARRVDTVERMNIQAEFATLKEFQRQTKETQDQNQRLLYGVFASVLTLAIERVWQMRPNKEKSEE